jgi:anti-anti-sigma factor
VSAVPFVDSTALGMVTRAAVERREHDLRLVLVGTGHVVRKVLAITHLGTLLPDVRTVHEAEELLLGSPPGPA